MKGLNQGYILKIWNKIFISTNTLTCMYNLLSSHSFTAVGDTHAAAHNSIQIAVQFIIGSQSTMRGQLLVSLKRRHYSQ